ncbi:MAG: hypothetical protein LBB90_07300 [Tannerella sp.]|nr:hypothetical protein [Tannerella sp.]
MEEISSCEEKKICAFGKKSTCVIETSTRVDGISTCVEKKITYVDFGFLYGPFLYSEKRHFSVIGDYAQAGTVSDMHKKEMDPYPGPPEANESFIFEDELRITV